MSEAASATGAARLLAVVLVLGLVLFGEIPSRGRWATDLANFAHGPALAVVTLFVLRLLPGTDAAGSAQCGRYWVAVAVVLPLAVLIELLQSWLGRDASFADLLRDALGIGAAIAFSVAYDRRFETAQRGRMARTAGVLVGMICCAILVAPLLVTAAAYVERERRFPVLVDFSAPTSLYFVASYGSVTFERARPSVTVSAGTKDTVALRVQLTSQQQWSVALWEPRAGWQEYRTIVFDMVNPTVDRLVLSIRLREMHPHLERGEQEIGVIAIHPHSAQSVQLPLRIDHLPGRPPPIAIESARAVVLRNHPLNRATSFYITRVRLQ